MSDRQLQEVRIIKKPNDSDFFGKAALSIWESKSLNKDLYTVLGFYLFSCKTTYIFWKKYCPEALFTKYIKMV